MHVASASVQILGMRGGLTSIAEGTLPFPPSPELPQPIKTPMCAPPHVPRLLG